MATDRQASHRRALINDFATRSFRDMADQDYIAARLAYRAHLVPQFLWASQQAIEKYLKCILLFNRIGVKEPTHDVETLLGIVEGKAPFALRLTPESRAFIQHVHQYGMCRYLETSIYVRDYEIVRLDRTVWDLRRYCAVLDYKLTLPNRGEVRLLDVEIRKIERSGVGPPKPYRLHGGLLERIVDKRDHPSREPLIWQNLFFGGRPRKTVRLRPYSYATFSPLSMHPEIVDDLGALVFLSKDVRAMCQALLQQKTFPSKQNVLKPLMRSRGQVKP